MLFQTLSPQHDNPLYHETESGLYTDVVVKAGAGVWRRPGSLLAGLLGDVGGGAEVSQFQFQFVYSQPIRTG